MAVQVLAGYWDLDLESRELILCPRSRQMFGIEGNSPKKLAKHDWLPRVHPDDMPVIEGELETAGRRDEVYTARFRAVRPDGSLFHILGVGRAAARNPKRFVGLNFDLAATAATADLESRRQFGTMARLANFLTVRSRPANENETPQERPLRPRREKPSRPGKITREESMHEMLLGRALAMMETRKLRRDFLNPAMFGEPAFDMLLALYATDASPAAILSLRILSPLIGVSEACAARWLALLVEDGLALSVGGEGEPGGIHAALTDKGKTALDGYLKALGKVQ